MEHADDGGRGGRERSQRAPHLARHRCFHVPFIPTRCSWRNMVERFFRDLTEKRIRRGVFRDVKELITPMGDYIDHHNRNPRPLIWTAKATNILEKV